MTNDMTLQIIEGPQHPITPSFKCRTNLMPSPQLPLHSRGPWTVDSGLVLISAIFLFPLLFKFFLNFLSAFTKGCHKMAGVFIKMVGHRIQIIQ